jgi:uncharacterized membrane protein
LLILSKIRFMIAQLIDWIAHSLQVFSYSQDFMAWNLFLAFIPLGLSVWLFRFKKTRSPLWILGFVTFVLFLPNAPYVLTDIIHLIDLIQQEHSVWTITLVLIPQYLIFILAGLEAYVISVINLGYYCYKIRCSRYITWMELITHALCAIGIYLGRFQRFNSWDVVTNPNNLVDSVLYNFTAKWPVMMMIITFAIVTILYWMMKEITLGVLYRYHYQRNPKQSLNSHQ